MPSAHPLGPTTPHRAVDVVEQQLPTARPPPRQGRRARRARPRPRRPGRRRAPVGRRRFAPAIRVMRDPPARSPIRGRGPRAPSVVVADDGHPHLAVLAVVPASHASNHSGARTRSSADRELAPARRRGPLSAAFGSCSCAVSTATSRRARQCARRARQALDGRFELNSRRRRSRPRGPISWRRSGSPSSAAIASASRPGSRRGHQQAVLALGIRSGMPPTAVATTGFAGLHVLHHRQRAALEVRRCRRRRPSLAHRGRRLESRGGCTFSTTPRSSISSTRLGSDARVGALVATGDEYAQAGDGR